ncbi:MAG: transcriptional regulator [Alphaproteobacteria bacterium]|nr:transcriptional regulator [Alphaproteobacteria bacterium]
MRDLLPGPRRFRDLLLPGLTPNVLSERLHQLEEAGLVENIELPPPAACHAWALTEAGRRLEPVVLALGAFGAPYLGAPEGRAVRARWMVVSLMRRYRGGLAGVVALVVDGVPYTVDLTPERLEARDGAPTRPDAVITGDLPSVAALLVRRDPDAPVAIEGDAALVRGLVGALASQSGDGGIRPPPP